MSRISVSLFTLIFMIVSGGMVAVGGLVSCASDRAVEVTNERINERGTSFLDGARIPDSTFQTYYTNGDLCYVEGTVTIVTNSHCEAGRVNTFSHGTCYDGNGKVLPDERGCQKPPLAYYAMNGQCFVSGSQKLALYQNCQDKLFRYLLINKICYNLKGMSVESRYCAGL